MATTPNGYPYPVGTDRVMDGDDAIHNLATKVDDRLSGGVWSMTVSCPTTNGSNVTTAVTFPAGKFTQPPNVTATPVSGNPASFPLGVNAVTAAGLTVVVKALATGSVPVALVAHATSI
jgi:hypothetical protein